MAITIADYLAQTLINAGVTRIWGVTGDSLNGFSDSMRKLGTLQWMHTRHEEVAAFAAGAEAAETGQLAVCAGSCGPGNLHLINGLYDCHRNRVPVLAIAAHIPSTEIGLGYFQETHPQELFKECSHYVELVNDPAQFPRILERAMQAAIRRRGVAVIVLPGDVALKPAPSQAKLVSAARPATLVPAEADINQLAQLLNDSEAVTLLCGSGCEGAHDEVVALADVLGAPVVHALRGKQFIEYDNPNSVGMTGLIGISSGYHAMEQCDTLVMLGTDFPYRHFYPSRARVAQIDINPEALGKRVPIELGINADVRASLTALLPHIKQKENRAFLNKALKHYQAAQKELNDYARPADDNAAIHPQYLTHLISERAADDAVFTVDVGTPTLWAARYLRMNGRRKLHGSFNHGSMANALPQALGAQAANPGKQIISLSGDGGLSMLLGDLLSARQLNLPVKIVVFNNSSLGFVAMEMKAAGYVDTGTDFIDTNYADIAKAAGLDAMRVTESSAVPDTIDRFLALPGPALLDVVIDKRELAMPPKITLEQAKGFSLYMLRAVLSGKGNEVVEIAKTNLR